MGAAVAALAPAAETWMAWSIAGRIATLTGLVLLGAGVYAAVLAAGGVRPAQLTRPVPVAGPGAD